jgi:hypothetical protein
MNPPVNEHPTIAAIRARQTQPPKTSEPLDAVWLQQLCLDARLHDVSSEEVDEAGISSHGRRSHTTWRDPLR